MDRRRAGALLALAACVATAAAAPTASNQTALDLYDGASEGCYYNFQHYGEGDRIMTNEPCLNCTCHNRMLMCYLRVCPFTKPIGQDCSVEKRADQCCPIVTCPDVPVDLLTSTSTTSPAEYGETGLGKLDRYGCSINGKYFPEGSKVPPTPNKPCEHCYCIRNMTTCVMQECTLHVDGCTPIYRKDVCCPVRYSCDHPEDEIPLLDDMTTTVRPTPGFLLTTTTLSPVTQMTQDCVHDDKVFPDGALIKTEKACEHCYCMKGDIVCVVQECGRPMENEGKNCTSMPPREGQCCPDTYICEDDEITTVPNPDIAQVTTLEDITTLSPPRRVSVEGSGYRSETDEPFTEIPTFEPETESSGEEQELYKPTDENDMLIPERETAPPSVTTEKDEIVNQYIPSTTRVPVIETEMVTTAKDKGEDSLGTSDQETTPVSETTSTKLEAATESIVEAKTTVVSKDEPNLKDVITPQEEVTATEHAFIAESTIADHKEHTSPDSTDSTESESYETTTPTRRKEDDEKPSVEFTTLKDIEEFTTKQSDITGLNTLTTESTTVFKEEQTQTSTTHTPEKDNEVLIQEPTTDLNLEVTTKSDAVKDESQSATTEQPEIGTDVSTSTKVELTETTSVNPIENEIGEESFPTSLPGRIPGEGDCLLEGVTYRHESIVPSSNNCHTSCKCINSIVKCEPIICSPSPDYMDNCQPMYDTPESCCPTYVCDHPRETVPPQSHSQMAGTESPIPTPAIECVGDQCEIIKDDEQSKPAEPCSSEGCTDDSSKKPHDCGPQGCSEAEVPHLSGSEECVGNSCSPTPEQCRDGKCETAFTKDQTCNNENGCEIPVIQSCEGDNCSVHPADSNIKDGSSTCDNADDCKHDEIPAKLPHCEGEACMSGLPPQTIPQEKLDCKDSNDCGQPDQTPVEECNEESCRRKQVPDIHKPVASDCTGTECTQEDNGPQITDAPQLYTEAIHSVTEQPESPETKHEEPVTDLPKTTAIEKETEPSRVTEGSISGNEEVLGTTLPFDELEAHKEKEPQPSESPATVTKMPDVQEDRVTDKVIDVETTMGVLHDITKAEEMLPIVTPLLSEFPTTEMPIMSDIDSKDNKETVLPESVTSSIQEELITNSPEDAFKDKVAHDITTSIPSLPAVDSISPEISQEPTESQETLAPEYLNRDGEEKPTKEPEYVHDAEPKVTVPAKTYTTAPEQMITDKFKVESIEEQEEQDVPTTPKTYNSQSTDVPEIANTKTPVEDVQDISTVVPETQTSSQPEEGKKEPELAEDKEKLDEHVTSKPYDTTQTPVSIVSPGAETAQTEAPTSDDNENTLKPELNEDSKITQVPDIISDSGEESSTTAVHAVAGDPESQTESLEPHMPSTETVSQESDVFTTDDKRMETPAPVTVHVQTQTPMSIVKDQDDGEIIITSAPKSEITTEYDELITKKPDLLESDLPLATESGEPSEKPIPDSMNISTVSAKEQAAVTTEKSISDLETTISPIVEDKLPTPEPVQDSEITDTPVTETSTENTPISVSISSEQPEPSVNDTDIKESSVLQENPTESAPITPSEDIDTKTSEKVKETSTQFTPEDGDIVTPTQEQINEYTGSTEFPELTIHEHPSEPPSSVQEPEQSVTAETATNVPNILVTVPQEIPEKDSRIPEDGETKTPLEITSQPQTEATEVPVKELVTTSPELSQTETTMPKADYATSYIPEISATEPQTKVTIASEAQVTPTHGPEIAVTEKEDVEIPVTQNAITSGPKISEPKPQEPVTEASQDTVTTASDVFVTEQHVGFTEAPESHGIESGPPISFTTESQKESTELSETSDIDPHKEISDVPEPQDITTTLPEIYATEPVTLAPKLPDTTTKISEVAATESSDKVTEETDSQEKVTSVPKISETEPQEVATKVPESQDLETSVPEIPGTMPEKDTTADPMTQDKTTSISEVSVTESAPVENTFIPVIQGISTIVPEISEKESQKETTEGPTHEDTSNIPSEYVTEPQKEVTEAPDVKDIVTNVPDLSVTISETYEPPAPESQDKATTTPESAETEPKRETTETPESQEAFTSPLTEPKKEITEKPETIITDIPDILATESHEPSTIKPDSRDTDSKAPETITTEYQKEVTDAPEVQDMITNVPEVSPSEPQKETTETKDEMPEKTITESQKPVTELPESQDTVTNLPEVSATEPQQELTESPVSPVIATNIPDILGTESDKQETEEKLVTKTPELTETGNEAEPEEHPITEKDGTITEPPLKITTKKDDNAQPEQQEFVTSTEALKIAADTAQPEDESLVKQSTQAAEALATESPDKIADSDMTTEKSAEDMVINAEQPQEEQEIATQRPAETTKTPEFIEPEKSYEDITKSPQFSESESDATTAPIEEHDYTHAPESAPTDSRRTEATSAPVEEEHYASKTTQSSETPEETTVTKDGYSETTPYLVLLEEHTHKKDIYTSSPDEEVTSNPSVLPQKDDEPLSPENSIDKATESAPGMETEKPLQGDVSDKDAFVPETTVSEQLTESALVSEEVTTISPAPQLLDTAKPQTVESNEISTSAPIKDEEPTETEKPLVASVDAETEKEAVLTSEKPPETTVPGEEFILATTKGTTLKVEDEPTTHSPLEDKFSKPDEALKPNEAEKPKPDSAEEIPKPGVNDVQPTEEVLQPDDESHFQPSGTSGYGQEPDYGEEDSFGPGTCRYGGKVYVSAQQIPRDDPCDFCFCFRSDIICLQQSCPPPIHGCHEEPIQGFCCPRYECPVSMATTLNVTTTTTTTTTTLPPHFLPHAYKGAAQRRGCQIKGHTYKVGEVVRASSGPCLHCTCGGDGQMKCDPKVCTPEPMLRQMIAAAVSAKRRR